MSPSHSGLPQPVLEVLRGEAAEPLAWAVGGFPLTSDISGPARGRAHAELVVLVAREPAVESTDARTSAVRHSAKGWCLRDQLAVRGSESPSHADGMGYGGRDGL